MNIFNQVKDSFNNAIDLGVISNSGILCIFVSGSAVRGEFYNGWSDIDIVVVGGTKISTKALEHLSQWRDDIMKKVMCKVGIDYVPSERLSSITNKVSDERMANITLGLHYLKNFHQANKDYLAKGILYKNENYTPITIPPDYFKHADTSSYNAQLKEQVYECWLRSGSSRDDQLKTLRVTVKACLYLMQTDILCKTGRLFVSYIHLIDGPGKEYNSNIKLLKKIYENQDSFIDLHADIINKQSKDALNCFDEIYQKLEKY